MNLAPFGVHHNRHGVALLLVELPDAVDHGPVPLPRAVAHVNPRHVHAADRERLQLLEPARGGPDGAHELRPPGAPEPILLQLGLRHRIDLDRARIGSSRSNSGVLPRSTGQHPSSGSVAGDQHRVEIRRGGQGTDPEAGECGDRAPAGPAAGNRGGLEVEGGAAVVMVGDRSEVVGPRRRREEVQGLRHGVARQMLRSETGGLTKAGTFFFLWEREREAEITMAAEKVYFILFYFYYKKTLETSPRDGGDEERPTT